MSQDQVFSTYGVQTKTIGADAPIGFIHPTSESPYNDRYYCGEKMIREEKDVIEGMIADLLG